MPETQSGQEGRLSIRRARRFLVILVVGAIVLMLVVAEVAIRLRQKAKYGSSATIEEAYTVDPQLNLRVPRANFSSGRISVNSLGFRGPEIPAIKPRGTIRLAFLGASTTWCAEVSGNDYVWPHMVTAALSEAFPAARFDYVNGSAPGYTQRSMLANLQHRVAPLQPDVIVIYEVANNLSGEMRNLAVKEGVIADESVQEFGWAGRYSLLWNLVEKNLRVLVAQRGAQTNQGRLEVDVSKIGAAYRQEHTQLVREAQRHASLVAVATFSIQLRREQSPEQQLRAATSALFYMPFATTSLIIESYERYNQIVREVAGETGALLIGGEQDIPGDPVHFADSVHFTDAGSRAMAQRVSRALASSPALRKLIAEKTAAR